VVDTNDEAQLAELATPGRAHQGGVGHDVQAAGSAVGERNDRTAPSVEA